MNTFLTGLATTIIIQGIGALIPNPTNREVIRNLPISNTDTLSGLLFIHLFSLRPHVIKYHQERATEFATSE